MGLDRFLGISCLAEERLLSTLLLLDEVNLSILCRLTEYGEKLLNKTWGREAAGGWRKLRSA